MWRFGFALVVTATVVLQVSSKVTECSKNEWADDSSYSESESGSYEDDNYPKCTKLNEVYNSCPDCSPQTCKTKDRIYHCPMIPSCKTGPNCHPACRCKPGYFRNLIGDCISASDCDKCPAEHEFFSCGGACDNVCATLSEQNQTNCPIINIKCNEMCYCEDGYARAKNNTCIPIKDCKVCPAGEVYSDCPPIKCDGEYCPKDRYSPQSCPIPKKCGKGRCVCGFNSHRVHRTGKCVRTSDCPPFKCEKDNEVYNGCPSTCPDANCPDYLKNVTCPNPRFKELFVVACKPACRCKSGYYRDSRGNCVCAAQCKAKCTKPNQVYDQCPDCTPQTCKTKDKRYNCPLIPANKTGPNCHPACRCKPGYFKNLIGDCIPASDCDKCPGDHEYYSCGVACDNVCATLSKQNQTNCPIINKKCNEMCYCEEGYARATNNTCILIKDCKPKCPNANEVYDPCDAPCPARRCDFNAAVVRCAAPPKVGDPSCLVGCRCKNGYLRDSNGICISAEKCQKKCRKANEVYDMCPVICPFRTCGIDDRLVDCSPSLPRPGDPTCAEPACRCKDQTFRDDKGNCVPWEKCPKCPKPNEVYDPCDAPCPARRCDFNAAVVRCGRPPQVGDPSCIVGCRCIDGYLKDSRGVCIAANKCPKCTKPNQVYDQCPDCTPQTCKTKDKRYNCPMIPANKTGPNCHPACRCKPGYFKNLIGDCIPASDCDKCPAEHEFFSCGSACDNVCATLNEQNQTNCPIKNIKCNEMCYCENGYARATNNTCIPVEDCKDDCKENEVYSSCPAGSCAPLTCAQAGYPIKCAKYSQCPGKPGCICKSGYLKNNKGICIPSEQCSSCGGDDKAKPGCGTNCGRKCSDVGKNVTICPLLCRLNGCDCKDNYYYDANRQKCVPACDCTTPVCRDDEELSTCANALCRAQECKEKGQPIACPFVTHCIKGCVCPEGTLRSANGLCIPENQCPVTSSQCKQNEIFSECANGICRAQDCKDKGLTVPCPPMVQESCKAGCVCQVQHLRKNGICVPQAQCGDKPVCKINEVYSDCSNGLCRVQDCKDKGRSRPCPPMAPGSCLPGCVCPEQYLRQNGTCVPEDQCEPPQPTSPPVSNPTQPASPPVYIPSQPASPPVSNSTQPASPPVYIPSKPASPPTSYPPQPASPPVSNTPQPTSPPVSNTPQPTSPPVSNTPQPTSPPVSNTPQPTSPSVCNQNQNSCGDVDTLQRSLEEASNTLAIKSLYQLDVATPGVSTIISAFSYFVLLAQLALYCNGQTFTEMINVLNVTTKDDIRCAFPGLSKSIQGTQGAEIDIGNKIYVNDQYQLSDQYKKDSVVVFNAGAENINFNNSTQAANTINKWVSDATKGKITDLVSADLFTAMTRLVLANAIYFKGIWKTEFNPNLTQSSDFYVNCQKTIEVQMMQQKGKFNYAESSDIDSQLVEIPYQNDSISLVLVSPNQQDGLRNVLDKMQDTTVIYKVLSELRQETVTIFMPKFDISSNINIKDILKPIGVQAIFGSNAELSGMVVPDEALYVSDALQKATITVNEQGSEAAAASVAVVATRSLPRPQPEYIVKADHPFMYLIKSGNLILFSGYFYG